MVDERDARSGAPGRAAAAYAARGERTQESGDHAVRVLIVMGVSGVGKTTVGRALADALGWPFRDADEFHSAANVEKMHRGVGLTDEDRGPWLATLAALVASTLESTAHLVLACSALRQAYRDALVPPHTPPGAVRFVWLDAPASVIGERLAHRGSHFATAALLPSQLATLEPPRDAVFVDARPAPAAIVAAVREDLDL